MESCEHHLTEEELQTDKRITSSKITDQKEDDVIAKGRKLETISAENFELLSKSFPQMENSFYVCGGL